MAKKFFNEEYETQHFKMCISEFYASVYNGARECFNDRLSLLEKYLRQKTPKELSAEELEQGINGLKEHTAIHIDKTLSLLQEHLMGKIFKIPDHVLLPEDRVQKLKPSDEQIQVLHKELGDLKKELRNEKYLIAKIKEEESEADKILGEQKKLLSSISTSTNTLLDTNEQISFFKPNVDKLVMARQAVQKQAALMGPDPYPSNDESHIEMLMK